MVLKPDSIPDQLYQFFVQEALELLHLIEISLLTLRQGRDIAKIHSLVRAANSIKGGANSVGLAGIEKLAQCLENTFRALYRQESEIDSEFEELLLQAYVCLRLPLLAQIRTGNYDQVATLAKAQPIFSQIEAKLGCALEAFAELPTAAELGASVAKMILTTDVVEQLDYLAMILSTPDTQDVIAALRIVAQEFAFWGEVLEIPEFEAIAHTTLTALKASPQAAPAIGKLALGEFRSAREAVLQGDRTLGWTPSPTWAEFVPLPTYLQRLLQASGVSATSERRLTTSQLFVCKVDSIVLTLPLKNIAEILIPQADYVKQVGKQRFLYWQERMIPVYQISDLLDYSHPWIQTTPSPKNQTFPMLAITQDNQTLALEVKIDQLIAKSELVIKSFANANFQGQNNANTFPNYIHGWMSLEDGKQLMVIDGAILLQKILSKNNTISTTVVASDLPATALRKTATPVKTVKSPTILVVDDSITVRKTLELTLRQAGYEVLQAKDGEKAIEQLQKNTIIELVICDVDMPKMNGFEFLNYRRQDPRLAKVPVVMLTSHASDQHRHLAKLLGVKAYFGKPYVNEEILAAIKTILS